MSQSDNVTEQTIDLDQLPTEVRDSLIESLQVLRMQIFLIHQKNMLAFN